MQGAFQILRSALFRFDPVSKVRKEPWFCFPRLGMERGGFWVARREVFLPPRRQGGKVSTSMT